MDKIAYTEFRRELAYLIRTNEPYKINESTQVKKDSDQAFFLHGNEGDIFCFLHTPEKTPAYSIEVMDERKATTKIEELLKEHYMIVSCFNSGILRR